MDTERPSLTRKEALAQMLAWLDDGTALERLRRQMPPGSTLEDALRMHHRLAQVGRRPSQVMSVDDGKT